MFQTQDQYTSDKRDDSLSGYPTDTKDQRVVSMPPSYQGESSHTAYVPPDEHYAQQTFEPAQSPPLQEQPVPAPQMTAEQYPPPHQQSVHSLNDLEDHHGG